ncbi:MAG TPA: PEP-CTERM sorting domain-containing protein [Terriglobales bacterium]|nr:PEP-CTERM sorting domain-containing protein [Terriglobales bacterium]
MRKIVLMLVVFLAMGAWANEVTFQTDVTQGCFGVGCTPTSSTASLADLTFTGSSFGPALTSGGNLTLTLGQFSLTDSTGALFLGPLTNSTFTAEVNFIMPSLNGQAAIYDAWIIGGVIKNFAGIAYLDFGGPQHFDFSGGSFDLQVNDLNLSVLGKDGVTSQQLQGQITNATAVPEPATLSLLGCGLVVATTKLRKKFKP